MKEIKNLTVNGEQYALADETARADIGVIDEALDEILAIQEELMGGETA